MNFRFAAILSLFLAFVSSNLVGQGFPNVAQTPGDLLSEGSTITLTNPDGLTRNPDIPTNENGLLERVQGRTAIIAYHNGTVYMVPEQSSSTQPFDVRLRAYDISDPDNIEVTYLSEPSGSGPVQSHGYVKRGPLVDLGFGRNYRAISPGVNELDPIVLPNSSSRENVYWPFTMSTFWTYSNTDYPAEFGYNGVTIAQWDHLGLTGVIGHPFIIGDRLLMGSDQTRSGAAAYNLGPWMTPDVLSGAESPVAPQLLDVITTGGPGGYWPEIYGADGQLLMVFPYRTNGNGIRVLDVTGVVEPNGSGQIEFVADIPLDGAACMYVQFQDYYAFVGSHKVDMRTLESVLQLDLNQGAPGFGDGIGDSVIDTSQFLLPIGNLLVCGGSGVNQGLSLWAHAAEADTTAPTVGYHVPQAGRTNYPLRAPVSILIHETLDSWTIVNGDTFEITPMDGPNAGQTVAGEIVWTFNDMLQFTPDDAWEANRTYEVRIQDSTAGDPDLPGIMDAAGNVMEPYSFTFSTGGVVSGNQAPSVDSFTVSSYPAAPAQNLTFDVTASDPDAGDTLEYRFDFGDGTPRTPWSAVVQETHSYANEGHFKALVQVRDQNGLIATQPLVVTVTNFVPGGAQPSQSAPIAVDEANRRVWTVNPDNNTVTAAHADTLAFQFETAVGADPRSVAIDAGGNAWIPCHDADRIDIVNPGGGLTDTIDLDYGDAPFGIILRDGFAWVSLMGSGEIARIDIATQAVTRLALGPTPRALAMTPDGMDLFVSRFISPENFGQIWRVDTAGLALTQTLRISKFAGPDHRDSTASGFGVANYLTGLAVSPDGTQLLVASNKMNTDRGALSGPDLDQDNTVRNIVSRLNVTNGAMIDSIDIDNSDSSHAVLFSPLGDYFFVALQGNNDVAIFDTLELGNQSGSGGQLARRGVGLAPQGLSFDGQTNQLFVKNFMDRSITALDATSFLQTGVMNLPSPAAIPTVQTEALTAEVLQGKRIFYNASDQRMSAEGYISCATCHLDGGHDGRIWDFTGRGEGLRNTTTLRGRAGTGHGPVHWTSNFDEIQDFEHDIRLAFGGSGFMNLTPVEFATQHPTPIGGSPKAGQSADLDALAAYVESLDDGSIPRSPHRAADGSLTAAGQAGEAVFASLNCRECHAQSNMIDNVRHDVGTFRSNSGMRLGLPLDGIDTQTLRGIWNTAPYFHNGSAGQLTDVFTSSGGTVIQGETGAAGGNAAARVNPQDIALNYDNIPRGDGFVDMQANSSLTFANLDGGTGGIGALEIRHTNSNNFQNTRQLILHVTNSSGTTEYPVDLPSVENGPAWFLTNWPTHRFEGIEWEAGPNNTLEIEVPDGPRVGIDEITIATADNLAATQVHRQVSSLTPVDRDNLLAYLLQLDGTPLNDLGPSPLPGFTVELPPGGEVILDNVISFGVVFNQPVTGFTGADIVVGGSAGATSANVVELTAGLRYRVDLSGMLNTGDVTMQIANAAAEDAIGRQTEASLVYTVSWITDDIQQFSDEFDDPSTLANWQRRHVVEGWNAEKLEAVNIDTTAPDHLHLMPTPSVNYEDNTAAFLFKSVTGDFIATMQVDTRRRDGTVQRPTAGHSLAGFLIREPRNISSAAPAPAQPPTNRLPVPTDGSYATDWVPGEENFVAFTVGQGGIEVQGSTPADVWHYSAGGTTNSSSEGYQGAIGVPAGVSEATLQVVRRGETFLFLRRHGDGPWIIEERIVRPDLPQTLQVGMTAITDYWGLLANNAAQTLDEDGAYHQNRNVFTEANGFVNLSPGLRADIDYFRFKLPPEELTETMLQFASITSDNTEAQFLADSTLASLLGDAPNQPYVPLAPEFATFVTTHGLSGDPTADFDDDGYTDQEEWAHGGTDPTNAAETPEWIGAVRNIGGSDYLTVSYLRLAGGAEAGNAYNTATVSFVGESSSDLTTWNTTPVHVEPEANLPAAPDGYMWGCLRFPVSTAIEEVGFLRLNLVAP